MMDSDKIHRSVSMKARRTVSVGPVALFAAFVCFACPNRVPRPHAIDARARSTTADGNPVVRKSSEGNVRVGADSTAPDGNCPEVDIFPVGDRALVTAGATVIGYVERGGPIVKDATLSKGLPKMPGDKISLLLGDWPQGLAAVVGSFTGSGNPGNHHAYVRRDGNWSRIDSSKNAGWDVPSSVAWDADTLWVHVPESFHLINGTLLKGQYPCTGSHRLRIERVGLGKVSNELPSVGADFFPLDVIASGKGKAFVWGWSACRPGLFVGALGKGHVEIERVPGTDTCTERTKANALPAMSARAFPAMDGGLYLLVHPWKATSKSSKSSCAVPTVYHRLPNGTWSSRGLVQASAALSTEATAPYVDPYGVLWAAAKSTVLAWTDNGEATEYPLGPSCAHVPFSRDGEDETLSLDEEHPVAKIVSASRDDIWAVVHYDRVDGLCRLGNHRQ
jgi:hypothetical protein